jgi:hypothetical protein
VFAKLAGSNFSKIQSMDLFRLHPLSTC